MAWNYNSREELEAAGYHFLNTSRCAGKDCGAEIDWWETPKGKKMPLDPDTLEPHWGTCVNAKEFRQT